VLDWSLELRKVLIHSPCLLLLFCFVFFGLLFVYSLIYCDHFFLLWIGIVKSLTKGKGDTLAIFSFNTGGLSVLHVAATFGHLEVCKYLVEELRGDVNAPGYGPAALGLSLSVSPLKKKLVSDMSMFVSTRFFDCTEDVPLL
jgi:hypothetical protein